MYLKKIMTVAFVATIFFQTIPAQTMRNTTSIHPISLIASTAIPELPSTFKITYERYRRPQSALILSPELNILNDAPLQFLALSGSGGLRRYLGKPESGIYLQTKAHVTYLSIEESDRFGNNKYDAKGVVFKLLGYIGVKGKWNRISIFADGGLGWAFGSVKYSGDSNALITSGRGLGFDLNFGIGYSYF
ncbi:hypothetical protein QA601_02680 [Chitinispirillales bacterium ANBcel5]|uniref:hypothetical protein n=1 Tax=Cellulosispirillum alkaliphilum TaxID=3039283 RepID=UPI002A58B83F|nr:hypothetical protein [Chitinispirillales bacterium ANBcel5]